MQHIAAPWWLTLAPILVAHRISYSAVPNKYSWHNFANVVYVDAPRGVGFSNNPSDGTEENIVKDSQAMATFLNKFLSHDDFKEFVGKVVLIGESFAGKWHGYLAQYLATEFKKMDKQSPPQSAKDATAILNRLDGLILFTPDVGAKYDQLTMLEFLDTRGLLSAETKKSVVEACKLKSRGMRDITVSDMKQLNPGSIKQNHKGSACFEALFGDDGYESSFGLLARDELNSYNYLEKCPDDMVDNVIPCYDFSYLETYLNNADVKSAMRAPDGIDWKMCTETVKIKSGDLVLPLYKYLKLLRTPRKAQVLIVGGDSDTVKNALGLELGFDDVLQKCNAGATTVSDYSVGGNKLGHIRMASSSDFEAIFATLGEAGHMPAYYRPAETFSLVEAFSNNCMNEVIARNTRYFQFKTIGSLPKRYWVGLANGFKVNGDSGYITKTDPTSGATPLSVCNRGDDTVDDEAQAEDLPDFPMRSSFSKLRMSLSSSSHHSIRLSNGIRVKKVKKSLNNVAKRPSEKILPEIMIDQYEEKSDGGDKRKIDSGDQERKLGGGDDSGDQERKLGGGDDSGDQERKLGGGDDSGDQERKIDSLQVSQRTSLRDSQRGVRSLKDSQMLQIPALKANKKKSKVECEEEVRAFLEQRCGSKRGVQKIVCMRNFPHDPLMTKCMRGESLAL